MKTKNITILPMEIDEKMLNSFFAEYHFGCDIKPAPGIAKLFLDLLKKDESFSIKNVQCLNIEYEDRTTKKGPGAFFTTDERNFSKVSLSPREILRFFFQNPKIHMERNFFILNNSLPTESKDTWNLSIVDIRFIKNEGKYFLYLYPYAQKEILCRTLMFMPINFILPFS